MSAAPETARIVRVFVSSPGDVAAERAVLDEVVESINRTDGPTCGVRLELWKWEDDAVPQIGPKPQAVIDAQTPAYDIYLGIMGHRFGTPTGRYGSGTEKEFRDALKRWGATGSPWILFYFSDAPIRPSEVDVAQLQKVDAFRQSVQRKGLYAVYDGARGSKNAFYEKISEHLRKVVRQFVTNDPSVAAPPPAAIQTTPGLSQDSPSPPTVVITGNTFVIQPPGISSLTATPVPPVDPTQYLAALRQRTAYIDIRGLQVGSGRAPRFPIDELYIPLTTSSAWTRRTEDAQAESPDQARLEKASGRIELGQAMQPTRLVIVGDPGAGKTTLLRRIAFLLCQAVLEDQPQLVRDTLGLPRPLLPIFVRVAELAAHIGTTKSRPEGPTTDESPGWIPHFLATASEEADLGLGEAFFRDRLEQGDVMLLLDGLDEAPTDGQRKAIATLLDRTTERYAHCRYVLTGRPAAFRDEQVLPGFAHVEIDPLEDEAIETFLRRWCQGLFPESRTEAERHLDELLEALRSRVEIRRMARNPVMLTALAVVHWNEKRLPEQRADLYESIITWLSRSREQRPGRPSPERCVGLLQELALAMQNHPDGRQTQVPRRWAADALAPSWRELSEDRRREQADRFLRDEELDSGIVVGRGDHVRFWHLTFQEYLAARALAACDEQQQRSVLLEQPKLYTPEWKEVVLLMAGVLYHHGVARVDGMISSVLATMTKHAQLADQAQCLGLLGAAVRDLSPVHYKPRDPRYQQLLDDVMGIFEPDWLATGGRRRAALWSRVVGLIVPARSQAALIRLAADAADVLGQAGGACYAPAELDNRWVTIPAGKFLMGAQQSDRNKPNYDAEEWSGEGPVHEVYLDEYHIARYPVTVGQFQRFVDQSGYQTERFWKAGEFGRFKEPENWDEQLQYPARPVVGVSWLEAAAYCVWAECRLPTEAEWERAARGTTGRKYPWGDSPASPARVNFSASGIGHPTPVGIYALGATPEGICDLAGNVWEWCADWYGGYTGEAVRNPRGPEQASVRVIRGGSWAYVAGHCRAANRYWRGPRDRGGHLGFRVARGPSG